MVDARRRAEELLDTHRMLCELFDNAWELNKSDQTRTDFTMKCTDYLSRIRQTFSALEADFYDVIKR